MPFVGYPIYASFLISPSSLSLPTSQNQSCFTNSRPDLHHERPREELVQSEGTQTPHEWFPLEKSVREGQIANPIISYSVHSKAAKSASRQSRQRRNSGEEQAQEGPSTHTSPLSSSESLPMLRPPADHLSSTQAIQQNHPDIAKIYAQNAIRKQNEKLNLLRLGSRIDAVASRVQTAVTMRQVTGSMAGVVRGMEGAMKAMDLEKVSVRERSTARAKKKQKQIPTNPPLLPLLNLLDPSIRSIRMTRTTHTRSPP